MILIDFQKAFDAIDRDIFLQKINAIGLLKYTLNWFKSYLFNRLFLGNIGKNFSQPASVSCGLPQLSILGLLLFLIYVNDQTQVVTCGLLYTDASYLGCQYKDIKMEYQLTKIFVIYVSGLWIIS